MANDMQPLHLMHFNGKRFLHLSLANSEACDVDQIDGFFEAKDLGVHLYNHKRELQAYVVMSRLQGYFVVTAHTMPDGRPRYMFGASELTERWLGLVGLGYRAGREAVQAIRFQASLSMT